MTPVSGKRTPKVRPNKAKLKKQRKAERQNKKKARK